MPIFQRASLIHLSTLLLALPLGLAACTKSSSEGTGGDGKGGGAAAARFFLPTGAEADNTSAPSLAVDATGRIHAVYPAYAGGRAYYASCGAACASEKDVEVVRFPTDGTVHHTMLALDRAGRPRVLLTTFGRIYFAACDAQCNDEASWSVVELVDHGGDIEVSGEAFALDPEGRPRFVMHTAAAYLGIGQKTPASWYVTCDADCSSPESWAAHQIAGQMYRGSSLVIDGRGTAHLATVTPLGDDTDGEPYGAYLQCTSGCTREEDWSGIGFAPAWETYDAMVAVTPSISLAVTEDGRPRVALLGRVGDDKNIYYFQCDAGCTADNWSGGIAIQHQTLGTGLDLALDDAGHPRFTFTFDYNIALARCDAEDCGADADWKLTKVEAGADMPPDGIFLYPNCNVGAWFLHSPSLALTADGLPRVGYQARDVSGGFGSSDPTKPACQVGTDMTLSRIALLTGVE